MIFSDLNAVRLDVNYRKKKKKTIKNTNIWRLNNMLPNNQEITEEIKKDIKICTENEQTQTLNDTMDHLDLIDIYSVFHPKEMNFTFFSSAHITFSRINHILGHKSSLGKLKKN